MPFPIGTIIDKNGITVVTNYCTTSDNCNKGNAVDNPKIWCDLSSKDDDLFNQSCTGECAVSYKFF